MAEAVIWAVEFPGFPSTQPHDRVESTKANAALFWIALVAFNLIVTILIVARLLILRARMIGTLGKQYGSGYTGIVAIVVESALIYDLWLTLSFMFFPGTPYIGSVFNPGITQSLVNALPCSHFNWHCFLANSHCPTYSAYRWSSSSCASPWARESPPRSLPPPGTVPLCQYLTKQRWRMLIPSSL